MKGGSHSEWAFPGSALLYRIAAKASAEVRKRTKAQYEQCRGKRRGATRHFTEQQVRDMRAKYNGRNTSELAAEYGLSNGSLQGIVYGKNYAWVI